jgi:excisionase family DNA binding protein
MTVATRPVVVPAEQLPHFLTVEQAAEVLGLGRSNTYEAIKRGQVPAVKFGRKIRVPKAALLSLGLVEGGGHDDAA